MPEVTILLSAAGRRGALVDLLRHGAELAGCTATVVASDCSPLSSAGHLADRFVLVPRLDDPDYLDALRDIIDREGIDIVVPTIDTELAMLATHRTELDASVLVSDPEVIHISADKGRSSAWFASAGFAVPQQYERSEVDDLPSERWPLFFKPLQGSSSIGAQPVESPNDIDLATERYGPGVIEELIDGPEYTMDCWVDRAGRCRSVVPRQRIAVRAGEIAKGRTVSDAGLEREVSAVVEALPGARGPITVQAIVADDGPRFIEVNPRFGGGYPLSHAAGATFTAAVVAEALGLPVEPRWFSWQDDLVMLRYDAAVYVAGRDLPAVR